MNLDLKSSATWIEIPSLAQNGSESWSMLVGGSDNPDGYITRIEVEMNLDLYLL